MPPATCQSHLAPPARFSSAAHPPAAQRGPPPSRTPPDGQKGPAVPARWSGRKNGPVGHSRMVSRRKHKAANDDGQAGPTSVHPQNPPTRCPSGPCCPPGTGAKALYPAAQPPTHPQREMKHALAEGRGRPHSKGAAETAIPDPPPPFPNAPAGHIRCRGPDAHGPLQSQRGFSPPIHRRLLTNTLDPPAPPRPRNAAPPGPLHRRRGRKRGPCWLTRCFGVHRQIGGQRTAHGIQTIKWAISGGAFPPPSYPPPPPLA